MIIKIIISLVIFLNLLLSFLVLTHNPKATNNRLFALIGIFAAIWTFSTYMSSISISPFWLKNSYAFGAMVVSSGLIWVLFMTEKSVRLIKIIALSFLSTFFFICSYVDGFIISSNNQILLNGIFTNSPGPGLWLYTIYYISIAFWIIKKLYINQKNCLDNKNCNLRYVFIGALITLIISGFSSFILPHFSIFLFGGVDSLGFLIFLITIAYSITKYKLFEMYFPHFFTQ